MGPKRVAIVCTGFPIQTETFILSQIVELVRLGYEVDIFPYKRWPDIPGDFEINKFGKNTYPAFVPPRSYPMRLKNGLLLFFKNRKNGFRLLKTLNPVLLGKNALNLTVFYSALAFLNKPQYHLVIANFGENGVGMEKLLRCGFLNSPLVVWFHGYDMSVYRFVDSLKNDYRRVFDRCWFAVGVSRKICRAIETLGCNPAKVFYLPCAPKDEFFRLRPDYNSKALIVVGRFVEKKAPHLTIRAFAKLQESEPDAALLMIGDGPLKTACEQLVIELKLKNVTFAGLSSHENVFIGMERAFCYVQHSVTAASGDSEGTPVGILEAGAAGLAVVSTRHGGIPDVVIEGKTGFLVDEQDVDGMAAHLLRLYQDRKLCEAMGKAARAHIQSNFSSNNYLFKLKQLLP